MCAEEKQQDGEREYDQITIECLQRDVRKLLIRQYTYARKMSGLTQAEVAKRAGISRTNVTRFESGEYNPTLDMLVKLASAMDMDLSITLNRKKG